MFRRGENKDTKASGTDGQKALRVLSGGVAYGRDCCRPPIGRTRTGSHSSVTTGELFLQSYFQPD
nr:hypothetical protein [Capnocytophaga cynodegmi]